MTTFQTIKLADIADIYSGFAFKSKDLKDEGIPVIKIKNVKGKGVSKECDQCISEDLLTPKLEKYFLQNDDVLVAMTGQGSLGRVGKMQNKVGRFLVNQRVGIIRPKEKDGAENYLFAVLALDTYEEQLFTIGLGAGQPNVSATDIGGLEIPFPEFDRRKEIGTVRAAYDSLIENNNRRIAILEDIVQSLYREWFVKFRFPGNEDCQFIDSPLGRIPDRWGVKAATDVIEFAPKMSLQKEGVKPFVSMPNVSTSSMIIDEVEMREGNSGTKFINGDTLLARITPCLQNGKTAFVQFLDQENPIGFGSTEFIVMRTKELTSEFVYCLARSEPFRGNAINSMAGADGRQRVKNDCFNSYMLAVPPKEILEDFSLIAEPAFKEVFNLNQKNKNLRKQRDMLLPKLISGTISLQDQL